MQSIYKTQNGRENRLLLTEDFHVYAVDIIGHPGKSDEGCLSHIGYDYGKWASEVIDKLGYDKMPCFGGSFGGGVLAKLMCVAPEKIEKAVLVVPAGINNALPVSSIKMMIPLLQYHITKKEKYLIKTALHMALDKSILDVDTLDTVKDSFDHVKTKVGMPTNIQEKSCPVIMHLRLLSLLKRIVCFLLKRFYQEQNEFL